MFNIQATITMQTSGGHFGFCRRCGIACGEQRVPPAPLGWYFSENFTILIVIWRWFYVPSFEMSCHWKVPLGWIIKQVYYDKYFFAVKSKSNKGQKWKKNPKLVIGSYCCKVWFVFSFIFLNVLSSFICFRLLRWLIFIGLTKYR